MKPVQGTWYVEADKGQRLFCASVDEKSVGLSYHPDSPIAIRATIEDFPIFFVHTTSTALQNLLDIIEAPPERNAAGDVTLEHHHRLGEAVTEANQALAVEKRGLR